MFKSIFKGLFGKSNKVDETTDIEEEIEESYQRKVRYIPEYHHVHRITDIESVRARVIRELNYEIDDNTYDEHIWYMR